MSLGTRSDHLVCTDPSCPTTCDPYTGRILCRCYQQMQDSRVNYQANGQIGAPPPPAYNSMYPQNYHNMDAAVSSSSALHAPPRLDGSAPFPPTTTLPQYPATLSPSLASNSSMSNVGNLDTLLRSQVYNYMNSVQYANLDLNGTRRKNATRESTSALKAWLKEHKKNPYPTKAEKVMLAIVTKMSLTQISTWFANARRRMKKENGGELKTLDDGENSHSSDEDNTNDSSAFNEASQRLQEAEAALHMNNDANQIPALPQAANGAPPNIDFSATSGLPMSGQSTGMADPMRMLFASDHTNDSKQSSLPSFSTFMGNTQNPPNVDFGQHLNNFQPPMPCDPAANMYQQGSYNTTSYSTSDFTANGTGNYASNFDYDSIANYFKQHPQFAHEYNSTGSDKENMQLPANHIQPGDFLTDSSDDKSDGESSGQKSTDSSPSSVKSKIWSITEIIGSSMSKIMDGTEQPLPPFIQSLTSTDQ